jgi:hypothetical protein
MLEETIIDEMGYWNEQTGFFSKFQVSDCLVGTPFLSDFSLLRIGLSEWSY